jgi:peptidoglycan L-alanyl-D-glutamate endopeptidase CwlK
MAKIPYQPWSTEQPIASSGATGFNVRATEDAFGTNVANAIAHAGTMVEGAGNELFNRAVAMKQLDNEAEARQITNDAELNLANIRVGYNNKQGEAAKSGFNDYQTAVKGVYEGAKARASNQAVARMVDGQTASAMRSSIFAGATHAATEGKKWQMQTLTNKFENYKNRLLSDPDNENLWNEASAGTAKIIGELSDFQGEPPASDNRKHDLAAAMSDLHSTRIKGVSAKEPERAAKMLEDNKQFILGQDVDKVDKLVTDRLQTQIAARYSHALNSGFQSYMRPEWMLRFNGVDERLQRVFQRAQDLAWQEGIRFTITDKGGVRDVETQRKLFRAGFSKTMNSNHLRGWAMDIAPLDENGKINWNDKKAYERIDQLMFQAAEELGVKFSAEHNQIKSWDPGHYSINPGESGPLPKYQPMTQQEMVRRAQTDYAKLRPGDDVGMAKVENAVIAQHGKFETMARQQIHDDKNTVIQAMALDPENQPYTEQDLLSRDGQVDGLRQSWDRLAESDPAWRLRLQNTMRSARMKQDDHDEYQRLAGMASGVDGHPVDFIDEDIWNNPKLSFGSKKYFRGLQEKIERDGADPRTPRAFKWMQGAALLPPELLRPTSKAQKKDRDVFAGILHEALQSWSNAHDGRQPTQRDVTDEIGPLVMRQKATEEGWFFNSQVPLWKHKIPKAEQQKIIKKYAADHDGYEPDEKEIMRGFAKMQFDELYERQKAGAGRGPR